MCFAEAPASASPMSSAVGALPGCRPFQRWDSRRGRHEKRRLRRYSALRFEIEALFKGDDALGVILKGHLYIEHFLGLLLATVRALTADKAFALSFARKINRALQAAIIPADEADVFCAINQIRNRFAHEPRAYFSKDDADAIWRALSPRMIDRFANAGRLGPDYFDVPLDLFKCCIIVMCSILEGELASRR